MNKFKEFDDLKNNFIKKYDINSLNKITVNILYIDNKVCIDNISIKWNPGSINYPVLLLNSFIEKYFEEMGFLKNSLYQTHIYHNNSFNDKTISKIHIDRYEQIMSFS